MRKLNQVYVLLLLGVGCAASSEPSQERTSADATRSDLSEASQVEICASDSDCDSRFCDLGKCAVVGEGAPITYQYGKTCNAESTFPICQGYVCLDARCRSCRDAADCDGDGKCQVVDGLPGKRCGAPLGATVASAASSQNPPPPSTADTAE